MRGKADLTVPVDYPELSPLPTIESRFLALDRPGGLIFLKSAARNARSTDYHCNFPATSCKGNERYL